MQGIFKSVLATDHLRGRLTSTAASLQPDPASLYFGHDIYFVSKMFKC